MKKLVLIALISLTIFLLGCTVTRDDFPSIAFSVSDILENIETLEGKTVLVEGSLGLQGCTKMACIPEKACCNSCFAELSDLDDPTKTIKVTGKDCSFDNSGTYEGTITKQNGEYVLILVEPKVSNNNEEVFEIGEIFTIKENTQYKSTDAMFTITKVTFTDSRCPEGVQCVWEGEQGVKLEIRSPISSNTDPDEILLGETTNPNETLYGFNFKLVSIDIDEGFAKISVTKKENNGTVSVSELVSNPEKYLGKTIILSGKTKAVGCTEMACIPEKACCNSCFGEIFDLDDESISITANGMDCAFEKNEFKGTLVKGTENYVFELVNPDAKPVPTPIIIKRDVPGFVPEEYYLVIETSVYDDGRVTIETTKGYGEGGEVSFEEKQLTPEQLDELKSFILTTNFFDLTEDETRPCIADAPTRTLKINLDDKSNYIAEIGAQCNQEMMGDTFEIIRKIEALVLDDPVYCAQDVFECENGKFVSRTPPTCEFIC
tara:strand:+ start:920 stop:2389 length:1470 start_codon:yes stop_codon:yes gene_type:complete